MNENCNIEDSTYSSCEAIAPPAPLPVVSLQEVCTPRSDKPKAIKAPTILVDKPTSQDVLDILCRDFGICQPSSSSSSSSSSSTSSAVNPCANIQNINLSWNRVEPVCDRADYEISGFTQVISKKVPAISRYEASITGGRKGTWHFSTDGGRSWQVIATSENKITGQHDTGWMVGLYSFLLRVITEQGVDIYQLLFDVQNGNGLGIHIDSQRFPSQTNCDPDYYQLVVPSPYKLTDVNIQTTGNITAQRIGPGRFVLSGTIGTVTGSVDVRCGSGSSTVKAVVSLPPLYGDGKGGFAGGLSSGLPGGIVFVPTENSCEAILVVNPSGGILTSSPSFNVSGGRLKQLLNPLVALIELGDIQTCVRVEYSIFSTKISQVVCLNGCNTEISDGEEGIGDLEGCGVVKAFATKQDSFFPCEPVALSVDTGQQCGILSILPSSATTTSSTPPETGDCTFSLGNAVRTGEGSYEIQLLNIGTQTAFKWQAKRSDGTILTNLVAVTPNGNGKITIDLSTQLSVYGLYTVEVIANRTPGSATYCSDIKALAFTPLPSTTSSTTTSNPPECTFSLVDYNITGGGILQITGVGVTQNDNIGFRIKNTDLSLIYPDSNGFVYPGRFENGIFEINIEAIAQAFSLDSGTYVAELVKGLKQPFQVSARLLHSKPPLSGQ